MDDQLLEEINTAYIGLRSDVISLLETKSRYALLDVGCSTGTTLKYCKDTHIVNLAVGLEGNTAAAAEAKKYADHVLVCDLDCFSATLLSCYRFDLIFFADVLEHIKNPDILLNEILKLATDDVEVIVSLPNVQHWTAISNLCFGKWPRRDRGLFDETHLRWFTLDSIRSLAATNGLRIEKIKRNMRIFDQPGGRINSLARIMNFWPVRSFFTYQYVVRLKRV
jgi:SAM-dependent methyltransferase